MQHILSADIFDVASVNALFEEANRFYALNREVQKKAPELGGRTLINLFYENSTRTRSSFELAGKRLGMDVINISTSQSSVKKGETLLDTAMTLNAMRPDVIVLRHPQSGAAALFSDFVQCHVVNAGDGAHQHPTQALLDAFTLWKRGREFSGLNVLICGDISHSRVARSNVQLLQTLGANVTFCGPKLLMPSQVQTLGCKVTHDFDAALPDADVIMLLRVQNERIEGKAMASVREYFQRYALTYARLEKARKDAIVMHPGPINRGVEIETALADDLERTTIIDQVEAGVAIRQAILTTLLKKD